MRKQVLEFAKKMDHLEVVENDLAFDLQKTDEYLSQTLSRNTAHNKIQEKRI
jgi:hypothetical protein